MGTEIHRYFFIDPVRPSLAEGLGENPACRGVGGDSVLLFTVFPFNTHTSVICTLSSVLCTLLPIDYIVLSIQVSSGKGNAHIVEVEGNGHTLIFLYPFPELPALILVHQHQHRPFCHVVHGFIVHTRQHYHVRHFSAPSRQYCHALASVLASLTQYVAQALTIHCPWPVVIGQAQEQMPQASHPSFLPPMQPFVHLPVGIVLLLVVQHICHKIKGKRRMHSIAFPLANAHQPHYRILKQHHNIHKDT